MHPLCRRRNRLDRAHAGPMSAAGGIGGGQSAATRSRTAELSAAVRTQCVSIPVRAACASGTVFAPGRPGRIPWPETDMVRGAVPFLESEERRLGYELGAAPQPLPGEFDRQQVLHVYGDAVNATGLFLRGHRLAAVEPCGEAQAVGPGSSRRHELRAVLERN